MLPFLLSVCVTSYNSYTHFFNLKKPEDQRAEAFAQMGESKSASHLGRPLLCPFSNFYDKQF